MVWKPLDEEGGILDDAGENSLMMVKNTMVQVKIQIDMRSLLLWWQKWLGKICTCWVWYRNKLIYRSVDTWTWWNFSSKKHFQSIFEQQQQQQKQQEQQVATHLGEGAKERDMVRVRIWWDPGENPLGMGEKSSIWVESSIDRVEISIDGMETSRWGRWNTRRCRWKFID